MIQASDGHLYGVAFIGVDPETGGSTVQGTIFRFTLAGEYTVLHRIAAAESSSGYSPDGHYDGSEIGARLLEVDGYLYGVMSRGGQFGYGTIFKISLAGAFSVVHHFRNDPLDPVDGVAPHGGLTRGNDGRLYGTTTGGGPHGRGTVYSIDADGSDFTMHAFFTVFGSDGQIGGTAPLGPLALGTDGNFYGTASNDGANVGIGTVFRFNPIDGTLTTLHHMTPEGGFHPMAGLIQGSDGAFYGTAFRSTPNANFSGTLFRITPTGVFTRILNFEHHTVGSASAGSYGPTGKLLEVAPGTFIGTAPYEGPGGDGGVIFRLTLVPPTATVVSPNGGEKLFTGTPYRIDWTADGGTGGISFFDVFVAADGVNYSPVPGCSGVDGALASCTWAAPGPASTNAKIKVTAHDAIDATGSDISNAKFTIAAGSGSITVTAPNTVVTWAVGTTQQIKWNHNLGIHSSVNIELSRDGVTYTETIASGVQNSTASKGTFGWVVTGPVTTTARVRVIWANGGTSDTSNTNFAIGTASITVTTPKASTNWGYGTTQKQTWTSNLGPADTVDVLLSTDGGATYPQVLASNVLASLKNVTFTAPTLGAPTTTARVKVVWSNPPAGVAAEAINPANFKVEAPFLNVTSPKNADVWTVGTSKTIKWTSNLGGLEQVTVDLSQDGGTTYPISVLAGTPSDGSQSVVVQGSWATTTAKIKITWTEAPTVADDSGGTFVIQ